MKAMSAGAIPITSRFQNSTLPELTQRFDLGPDTPLSVGGAEAAWRELYVAKVVDSVAQSLSGSESISHLRSKMKEESRTRFSWSNVAKIWKHAIES